VPGHSILRFFKILAFGFPLSFPVTLLFLGNPNFLIIRPFALDSSLKTVRRVSGSGLNMTNLE
jgi:hypothetical protein